MYFKLDDFSKQNFAIDEFIEFFLTIKLWLLF